MAKRSELPKPNQSLLRNYFAKLCWCPFWCPGHFESWYSSVQCGLPRISSCCPLPFLTVETRNRRVTLSVLMAIGVTIPVATFLSEGVFDRTLPTDSTETALLAAGFVLATVSPLLSGRTGPARIGYSIIGVIAYAIFLIAGWIILLFGFGWIGKH
jgi:hypothetical protein